MDRYCLNALRMFIIHSEWRKNPEIIVSFNVSSILEQHLRMRFELRSVGGCFFSWSFLVCWLIVWVLLLLWKKNLHTSVSYHSPLCLIYVGVEIGEVCASHIHISVLRVKTTVCLKSLIILCFPQNFFGIKELSKRIQLYARCHILKCLSDMEGPYLFYCLHKYSRKVSGLVIGSEKTPLCWMLKLAMWWKPDIKRGKPKVNGRTVEAKMRHHITHEGCYAKAGH